MLADQVVPDGIISVRQGRIQGIHTPDEIIPAQQHLDMSGKLIFPGLVDGHVHALSNPGEGIARATASAAAGGVTTIIEMPYDKAGAINTPERFSNKIDMVSREAFVDTAMLATLPKQATPEMIDPLLRLGPCGIKLSIYETDPERFPRIDDDILWDILPVLAARGVVTGFHAENDRIIETLIARAKAAKDTDAKIHCRTRPPISESLAVGKLLEFSHYTKLPLHLYHVSHPRCLELAHWYRENGANISIETCPHYLALCEDDMDQLGSFGKINPPLRHKNSVDALWKALAEGLIDTVGSDHAPWSLEQKNNGNKEDIFTSQSGAPGLESLFPVMYTEGVHRRGVPLPRLAAVLSENPARRFGLADRKGRIAPNLDADFTIVDPDSEWIFEATASLSSAKWSPFAGMKMQGKIIRTIQRGKTIFVDGKLLAKQGDGHFLPVIHTEQHDGSQP